MDYFLIFFVEVSVEMSGSDGGVGEGIVSQAIAEAVEAIKVFASEGLWFMMFKINLWVCRCIVVLHAVSDWHTQTHHLGSIHHYSSWRV